MVHLGEYRWLAIPGWGRISSLSWFVQNLQTDPFLIATGHLPDVNRCWAKGSRVQSRHWVSGWWRATQTHRIFQASWNLNNREGSRLKYGPQKWTNGRCGCWKADDVLQQKGGRLSRWEVKLVWALEDGHSLEREREHAGDVCPGISSANVKWTSTLCPTVR